MNGYMFTLHENKNAGVQGGGVGVGSGATRNKEIIAGASLGDTLGVEDGVELGSALGMTLGSVLGMALGSALGIKDVVAEGASLGDKLGLEDGAELGSELGMALGSELGCLEEPLPLPLVFFVDPFPDLLFALPLVFFADPFPDALPAWSIVVVSEGDTELLLRLRCEMLTPKAAPTTTKARIVRTSPRIFHLDDGFVAWGTSSSPLSQPVSL